ncbi:MAG: ABC transporter ATP-binding protein [Gemmatimonadaceae bacterium]|jgi:putative ABC transport system ATP-binding protein|nr:ABC transporter ATP-binding protein [Gemmatimonadaceae bacterium]
MTIPIAPPSPSIAVSMRGIEKAFGEGPARVQALRGIDLDIPIGEMVFLVGPSGCGKTTLIQVMCAILHADAGACTVFGREVGEMETGAQAAFRRDVIGFCFQQYQLIPTLTAAENAAIPLLIARRSRREALERARHELDALGLGDRTDSLPSQLSGGQQQRVAIARALVHAPRLVVCDEPTSALDHRAGALALELLRERMRADGRAIVIVTHDTRILHYGDRICTMDDGRIVSVERTTPEPVPSLPLASRQIA